MLLPTANLLAAISVLANYASVLYISISIYLLFVSVTYFTSLVVSEITTK